MYLQKFSILSFCFLFLISPVLQAGELTGLQVMENQDSINKGFKNETATGKLTIISPRGVKSIREFRFFIFETPKKTLLKIISPPDLFGVGLLSYKNSNRNDDQWLYLPALKKTKRISGSSRKGRFIGSDFSYEDFSPKVLEDYTYKLLKKEACKDTECYVVESIPLTKDTNYSKTISWVRSDNFQTVKAHLYNKKGNLYKNTTFENYKILSKNFWRSFKITMRDVIKKRQTVLEFKKINIDLGLTDSDFSKTALTR